ncbi:hypothetical protein PSPO01_13545 [Paraphaeosphaeria sporulosa]
MIQSAYEYSETLAKGNIPIRLDGACRPRHQADHPRNRALLPSVLRDHLRADVWGPQRRGQGLAAVWGFHCEIVRQGDTRGVQGSAGSGAGDCAEGAGRDWRGEGGFVQAGYVLVPEGCCERVVDSFGLGVQNRDECIRSAFWNLHSMGYVLTSAHCG